MFSVYLMVVLNIKFVGRFKSFSETLHWCDKYQRNKYKSETQPKQHLNDPSERLLKRDGKMNLIKIRIQNMLIGKTFDISAFPNNLHSHEKRKFLIPFIIC